MSARPKSVATVLPPSPPEAGYERDFAAWSADQAARLQALAPQLAEAGLDIANIAEEIESLGRSDLHSLESHLATITAHLLKLEHSPAPAPRADWSSTVGKARRAARDLIEDSPSLASRARLPRIWRNGQADAADGLRRHGEVAAVAGLPSALPYTLDQLLDEDFRPANRHGLA